MAETSAVARVFAVPDLLESILLEADAQDALVAQRVSREFRSCLQGSVALLRKLFFHPCDLGTEQTLYGNGRSIACVEPGSRFVPLAYGGRGPSDSRLIRIHNPNPSQKNFAEVLELYTFNRVEGPDSLIVNVDVPTDLCPVCSSYGEEEGEQPGAKPLFVPPKLHQSWRKMCLIQPAVDAICLLLYCKEFLIAEEHFHATTPLGELVDWMEDEYMEHIQFKLEEREQQQRKNEPGPPQEPSNWAKCRFHMPLKTHI